MDSATQQNFGNDLNRKKSFQHPSRDGDNPRASKLTAYTIEEARLTKAFRKFKLNESPENSTWATKRELSQWLDAAIKSISVINELISPEEFNQALELMLDDNIEATVDMLMQNYTDHNGGEMRNAQIIGDDLFDELDYIKAQRRDETLETAGDSTGESATLKALHHKGVDSHDGVKAKVFGPTESYPSPWTAKHVGGKYPIYSIKAANKAEVATWLNQEDAMKVVSEVS